MSELARYEAAERALAAAEAVDEVLEIRSQASAWAAYAKQAKNRDLEIKAARIRFRAERRLGEMLLASDLSKGGRPREKTCSDEEQVFEAPATLAEVGIDRKLSSRSQRLAAMGAAEFEQALTKHAEEMRTGAGRVAMDLLKIDAEAKGRAHRRDLAQVLSAQSVALPAGRAYPCAYIDPPWARQGGIGNRAYENHYPTMPWPAILDYLREARGALLPDSWAFMWIPRAHLLAPVEAACEAMVVETGEMTQVTLELPLAFACMQALGMDCYSTCFVWTKTSEEHPDVSGSGLIVWDQDELLLLFKRGRGLPKPAGAEKFGSNHRERATDHSRKPDFYRHMIATMVGSDSEGRPLPVLEMFARVDAAHPLPPGWDACGNQAAAVSDVAPQGAIVIPTDASESSPSAGLDEIDDYPREEASGTAREAPSTLCEREPGEPVVGAAVSDVGTKSAPPHASQADRLDWEALCAVAGGDPVDEIVAADLLKRGLIIAYDPADPGRGYLPTKAGGELGQRLHAIFWEPPSIEEIRQRFGNDVSDDESFAAGVPSDAGETVAAAADATADGASPAAAVADDSPPAFPPAELYELRLFEVRGDDERIPATDEIAALAPGYVLRGLVHAWCGSWRLTTAGFNRIAIVKRERAAREAVAQRALSFFEFSEWHDLEAVQARQPLDGIDVRRLVGEDLAWCTPTRVLLTGAGAARLAELEAAIDAAAGVRAPPRPAPIAPKQLDLVDILQGAP